ncbi:MAG TPA: DciA family protein [Blastocatellia bacterium]|nr:DciA family protein [Blastocatellia bacterium]
MYSLLKMLPAMIRLSGDNEEVREQAVFAAWHAATGGRLENACAPFHLYHRTLVVAIKDQNWKRQMERESKGFIFKLNSLLGAPLVTYIEFRLDPVHVEQSRQQPARSFEFHHTKELKEELKPAAEQIKDESLREAFLRAAARCLERKDSRG